ncbi:MAG: DNA polymerase I [Bacteroidetes bacterium]|nr:DNA polymerase I [Bacteroidota bacterium]
MSDKKKFVIVDALALAYKAYFAFINRPLKNSAGESTSAVFGFTSQLLKIIEDTNPDYLAVAFDSKEKTFRHEMYDLYKSSRSQMPDDMIPQLQRIKDIVSAFNIPLYIIPGYEADDIIGTAVCKAEEHGLISYAVTPDKDYIQLITENVFLIKPGKSTDEIVIVDKKSVEEDLGISPDQMIDFLALVGDSSDDIPGVAGIGPKTAVPLLQEFRSLENLYANIDKISKKGVQTKLEANRENAFLSKTLATIVKDVPIKFDFEEAKFTEPNFELLLEIFKELEFKNYGGKITALFNKAQSSENETAPEIEVEHERRFDKSKVKYKLIRNNEDARKLTSLLQKQGLVIFDTETDSLDVLNINLAGASFCFEAGEAYFVAVNPFMERGDLFAKDLNDRLSIDEFKEIFTPFFENESIKKVCQNGKYDIAVLRTCGISVKNFHFDTMLASYIIDPDQKHGMDALSNKYLNYNPILLSELIGTKKDASLIFEADIDFLSNYACEDADITFQLYEKLNVQLSKEAKLLKLAHEVEFPLVPVLEDMERTGIRLDVDALANFSAKLLTHIVEYSKAIYKIAGEEFNINSTKQLQHILFEKLNLNPTKKTKTGFSTDAHSLEALLGQNEIIQLLLDYRQAAKLNSTYAEALPKLIDPNTGRIHTSFNQTVASTGRLSSLEPNLQNIPIRTELGKEIRKAFVPADESHVLISADYSQIELRIMASICGDEGLKKAFMNNEDIHRSTAALVFQVPADQVTDDMRRKAKEVNFGILYGIGAFGLKTRLGILQSHAQGIIDTYFGTFKKVKQFMDDSVMQAKENGYAETILGRRRYLPNINSSNRMVRQFEERVAINMPIQGTAADMIKLAMINIHNKLNRDKFKTKMVLQVHDELVFDAPKDELDEVVPIIKNLMETALPLDVPVVVDTGFGDNWLEAH